MKNEQEEIKRKRLGRKGKNKNNNKKKKQKENQYVKCEKWIILSFYIFLFELT